MHTEEACKHAPIYLATMYVCIAHSSYFKEAIVIHDKLSRGAPILFSDFIFLYGLMFGYTHGSACNMKTTASAVSFSAILSCEMSDFGQQLSV